MSISLEGVVQRGHPYAIVDEVDSILIDEARTPLIISGEPTTAAKTYYDFARVVARPAAASSRRARRSRTPSSPHEYDYLFDEKHKTVSPTESGIEKVERALKIENLYDPRNVQLVNHLIQALKAEALYKRDVDYVVEDGEVKIVDEFTGRIMEGRRWSEGLHQAVEAKEGVADPGGAPDARHDHAPELLPPLREARRHDRHREDRGEGVRRDLRPRGRPDPDQRRGRARRQERPDLQDDRGEVRTPSSPTSRSATTKGQPVLVGTIAVETSEYLSELLKRQGVPHNVLNAKEHAREAEIIKDAGEVGAVTIATNMAGRGVDIKIDDRCASSAASTSSAPSATSRAGSTTSSAAAPAARATPARRASTSPARTTSCACSPATGSTTSWSASSSRTTSRWRRRSSRTRSRTRRRRSRSRTSSRARTSSSTTT